MIDLLFGLCALTAAACAMLLMLAWRRTRSSLLWWSGLCFSGLFLVNLLLVFDKIVLPDVDLHTLRLGVTLASVSLMLYGLVVSED